MALLERVRPRHGRTGGGAPGRGGGRRPGGRPLRPEPEAAIGTALAAGLCLVAAVGGVLWVSVPGEWTVPGCLVCAIALPAAERTPLPLPLRQGLVRASAAVQGFAVLWALPLVVGGVLGPAARAARPWSGAPRDIRDAVFTDVPPPPYASTVPLVLAVVAAALVVAGRRTTRRPAVMVAALVLGWAAVFVLPVALRLPYPAGLVAQAAVVVAVLGFAVPADRAGEKREGPSPLALTALLLALVTSVDLALLSLASQSATIGRTRGSHGPVRCGRPPGRRPDSRPPPSVTPRRVARDPAASYRPRRLCPRCTGRTPGLRRPVRPRR
ncbi:hypothetical protein STENM36S_07275 [Streptomyces tendae]